LQLKIGCKNFANSISINEKNNRAIFAKPMAKTKKAPALRRGFNLHKLNQTKTNY
jgi:hypothetical protein